MGLPPITVGLLIGALVFACVLCVTAALFAWRAAWPVGVRRLVHELRERVEAAELDWRHVKGQLAVEVEELEELEQSIERKRARVAARDSAAKRDQAATGTQGTPPTDREALKRYARSRGFQV